MKSMIWVWKILQLLLVCWPTSIYLLPHLQGWIFDILFSTSSRAWVTFICVPTAPYEWFFVSLIHNGIRYLPLHMYIYISWRIWILALHKWLGWWGREVSKATAAFSGILARAVKYTAVKNYSEILMVTTLRNTSWWEKHHKRLLQCHKESADIDICTCSLLLSAKSNVVTSLLGKGGGK